MKITGQDALQKDLRDSQKFGDALKKLKVQCNLLDPASVEAGLRDMEAAVNREARRYPSNKMIQVIAHGAKEALRKGTLE